MSPSLRLAALVSLVSLVSLLAACAAKVDGNDPAAGPDLAPPACGALTACGAACVSLADDPSNCGACDRSCVIPNAVAACRMGECTIATCAPGTFNSDGRVENGCESQAECQAGAECQTACGSTGRTACNNGLPQCAPPAETCNGVDDNCNGQCDEGALAGCRVGVHRSAGLGGHFYTTDLNVAQSAPFRLETANYFHLYRASFPGTQPLYLCIKGNRLSFLTTSPTCEALNSTGQVLGYAAPDGRCGAQPLYRLYSGAAGDHFYTTSDAERQNAVTQYGYTYEGVAAFIWPGP